MHYYKRNIGDYSKKAGRLSILQHGVYTLLIDACYDRERFPTRAEALDWVWAGTPEEIQAVDFVLSKFFTLKDGVYVQKRIAEEIEEYHVFCEQQAAKGKAGGRPKKPAGLPMGSQENPEESHSQADESLTTNHEPLTKIPSGADAPTLWDVWLSIPGVGDEKHARSHLGKLIKQYGEFAVAQAVAVTALKKPAEPNAFIEGQLKANPKTGKKPDWAVIPQDDNKLWDWAKKHNYSNPGGLDFYQYRRKLQVEVEVRLNQ